MCCGEYSKLHLISHLPEIVNTINKLTTINIFKLTFVFFYIKRNRVESTLISRVLIFNFHLDVTPGFKFLLQIFYSSYWLITPFTIV